MSIAIQKSLLSNKGNAQKIQNFESSRYNHKKIVIKY